MTLHQHRAPAADLAASNRQSVERDSRGCPDWEYRHALPAAVNDRRRRALAADDQKLVAERQVPVLRPRVSPGGESHGVAVLRNREVMGATDPKKAARGTIRADLAESIERNVVHGSDAPETARVEIAYFFDATEIHGPVEALP